MSSPQVATLPSHQAVRRVHSIRKGASAVQSQPLELPRLKSQVRYTGREALRLEGIVGHATAPAGCFFPFALAPNLAPSDRSSSSPPFKCSSKDIATALAQAASRPLTLPPVTRSPSQGAGHHA